MNDFELSGSSDSAPAPVEETVVDTPSETTETEVPAPEKAVEDPAGDPTPEAPSESEKLYETPDGRKVTADELSKLWKENFYPEFTRKSQELSELKRGKELNNEVKDEKPWDSPDYTPETYADLIKIAKEEAKKEIFASREKEIAAQAEIKSRIENEINELKKIDPSLDENTLFQHANKYGFSDLRAAHSSLTDFKKAVIEAEQRTLNNLKKREAIPVAGANVKKETPSGDFDAEAVAMFDSPADYYKHLTSLKNK